MKQLGYGLVLAIALLAPAAAAQSTSAQSGYPAWTGAGYPFGRHLAIMLEHMDGAALAMAENAHEHASRSDVKRLAAEISGQRSAEIATLGASYQKQYGEAMPTWGAMSSGTAGGSGMMSGGGMSGGGMSSGGMSSGGMSGSGMSGGGMSGGGMSGSGMSGTGKMSRMMTYGDNYQMMMGDQPNWWSHADSGFVPALMRLDAMQVSMATLGLGASDAQTAHLCRTIVSSRTAELSRLSKLL